MTTLPSHPSPNPESFDAIKDAVCAAADRPLARATTLPRGAYTSAEFFRWEAEAVLRAGWQAVAHVSQLPQSGDFVTLDLLGEPLMVIRGKDGVVRTLSRVCPHRSMDISPAGFGYVQHGAAAAPSGAPGCGHAGALLCPYHAWSFDLDGRLKACPEMQQAEGFQREEVALHRFHTEVWQGFVFVNLSGEAAPLAEDLVEMEADLAAFRCAELQVVVAREWSCEFNWKVLVENFMESYHHLGIHHKTLQPTMPARHTWTEAERRSYVRAHLPYKESMRSPAQAAPPAATDSEALPPIPGLSARQLSEWGLFLIHPTFLLATAPDRVIWYRLQPLGPDRLTLLTTTLVPAAVAAREDFPALRARAAQVLAEFHLEDMEVCTAVQRGLHARAWRPGRLSHLEMPVWLIQRFLAARLRGRRPGDDGTLAAGQR